MTMRASLIIEARERASAVFQRIGQRARGMNRDLKASERASGRAGSALARMGTGAAERLRAVGRRAAETAVRLRLVERAAYGVGRGIGSALRWSGQLAMQTAQWAALGATAGIGAFLAGVITTTSKFEQFAIVLENTEGSAAAARRSMAWVEDFAKRTPFELDQVMEAFVRLRSYGIDPTDGTLQTLGDTASATGKNTMDAIEMMADAQMGEFERLKEFGVRARVVGNRIVYQWSQNGHDMERSSERTASSIRSTLLSIYQERYGGLMVRQAQTLAGIWSNIKDTATSFMRAVGEAGIFDLIKSKLQIILNNLTAMANDGRLAAWAENISTNMEKVVNWAWRFAEETDWQQVGRDARDIAGALWTTARALAQMVIWAQRFKALMESIPGVGRPLRMAIDPIGTGARTLGEAGDFYDRMRGGDQPRSRTRTRPVGRARVNGPMGDAAARSLPAAPRRVAPLSRQQISTRVGGDLTVRVAAAPGTTASVTAVRTSNPLVPIRTRVNRGAWGLS